MDNSQQIDVISDSLNEKILIIGAVTSKNKSFSLSELEHFKESVSIFTGKYRRIYYFVYSNASFSNGLLALHDSDTELLPLDKMIRG